MKMNDLKKKQAELNDLKLPNGVELWSALEPMEMRIEVNEATKEMELIDDNADEILAHSPNTREILRALTDHPAFKDYVEQYVSEELSPVKLFQELLENQAQDETTRLKADLTALDEEYPYLSRMIDDAGIVIKPYKEMPEAVQNDIQEWTFDPAEIDENALYYTTPNEIQGFAEVSDILLYWYSDQDLSSGFVEDIPEHGTINDLLDKGYTKEQIEGYQSILRLAERDGYLSVEQLSELGVSVKREYYAVYDTQSNDFRTLGTFETGEAAMEAAAEYFVNVLDPESYADFGGEAYFHHSTAQEDGELLGFTAVEVTEDEAKLIEQATESQSSVYYGESFTGIGETYQKFPPLNTQRSDIFGRDLLTGKQTKVNPLARQFLEQALEYLRINGELTVEERAEIEKMGMPVSPRTEQELILILKNDWFKDLYNVYDDELDYFNITEGSDLSRLDIEKVIPEYLTEHPFVLDLPTLYSLAQKGGTMSYTYSDTAMEGRIDYTDIEMLRLIYKELTEERGLQEGLESLGITNSEDFGRVVLDFQKQHHLKSPLDLRVWAQEMMSEVEGNAEIGGEVPLLKQGKTFYNPVYTDGEIISFSVFEKDNEGYFEPHIYDSEGHLQVTFSDLTVDEIEKLVQATESERQEFDLYVNQYADYQAKQESKQVELHLTRLTMIEEIKKLPVHLPEKQSTVGQALSQGDFVLEILKDYRNTNATVKEFDEHSELDFILSKINSPDAVLYVGKDVEPLLDAISETVAEVSPYLRKEWSQTVHEIFETSQQELEDIQDWMMDNLKFIEHYEESVDAPIDFEQGKYRGIDYEGALHSAIGDTTEYWVEYENEEHQLHYSIDEIASLADYELPFEAIKEILETVNLTIGKVVEMTKVEKMVAIGEQEKSSDIDYYQKTIDSTVVATGTIDGIDIEQIDFWDEAAITQFELSKLAEKELVALTLRQIQQIWDTSSEINAMDKEDSDYGEYLDNYETEKDNYRALAREWERRGIRVPQDGAEFDANEIETSQPLAFQFEQLLSDYLMAGNVNLKEKLPVPQKDKQEATEQERSVRKI